MRDIASPLDGFASPFGPGRRTLTNLLFGQNEPGFTFEPWDITTLYQDRAGTTPVTAVGQSVGKRLDKSGRGNHEVAINDAARGVYGREPENGTRNLLKYTEQFDNAAWNKTNITATASVLTETTATGSHNVQGNYSNDGVSKTWALSVEIKANGRNFAWIDEGSAAGATFTVNLTNGSVNLLGSAWTSVTVTDVGDGWYRIVGIMTRATSLFRYRVGPALDASTISYAGDATKGIQVRNAQLEINSTATAYQRVVSQYDVTEAGVVSCYYVQTDGVDDAYVTPTITPGTDKVQVFAGVRKLSDATVAIIAEMGTTGGQNGIFTAVASGSTYQYAFSSRGTLSGAAQITSGYAAPITNVFTGLGDISGDLATLRVNGTQVAQSTNDQGTGNYLAYPAYIYARGGTSLPFNGRDYGHAVRFGPNLDAATIARVEALIARNTPTVTL